MKFNVMDHTGHSTLEFTADQKAEANATFDRLLAEGKIAGTRKAGQTDYQKVKTFDQLEDETTFTPARQGGQQFARSALGVIFTEDDGLSCRWLQSYVPGTDSLLTRFDCLMPLPTGRALQESRQFNHIDRETIEFALEFHAEQIEECKRHAREQPGTQFSTNWPITHEEMTQRCYADGARIGQQLRVRLPRDYTVRGDPERINVLFGHMHVRPEWAVGHGDDYGRIASEANVKSIELLKSWLLPSQLEDYNKSCQFVVRGSDSGKFYRLISERSYNILELDDAMQPTGQKFCVVPAQSVAMGDQLLAQKIWLETDERRTLKIANKIARAGQSARGNLGAIDQITRQAIQLFQNSNAFLRNLPQYEEVLGEPERPTQGDD